MVEVKLCECGCRQPAPIARRSRPERSIIKGQYMRFVKGHPACKTIHGAVVGNCATREYAAYCAAKTRCTNPTGPKWADYGGRGIEFRFTSFEQWIAELGPRPTPKHSVDRIRVNGHYEPGNVKWSTAVEQNANRRCSKKYRKPLAPLLALIAEQAAV